MNAKANILLVEDDESLGFLIKDNLTKNGWSIQLCTDGEKGWSTYKSQEFDLCVLDVMLPHQDGFSLATEIRKIDQHIPIIFLTAKNMTEDKIRGFQIGADDYITKPFSIDEFLYRIEAILRRTNGLEKTREPEELTFHNARLDIHNLKLFVGDESSQLTHKECKLLQIFFQNPNRLIQRDTFLKTVWKNDGFFVARSMDVFISRIRKYLKTDPHIRIENIRGVGYIMKG